MFPIALLPIPIPCKTNIKINVAKILFAWKIKENKKRYVDFSALHPPPKKGRKT